MTHRFPAAGPMHRALKHLASERDNIMKISLVAGAAAFAAVALAACGGAVAQGRDTIQIAGSSTVLPFASIVAEECFWNLDAPIVRITSPHVPLPAADRLEDATIPSVDRIVETVRRSMG